jgi:drug/metabolite transporter (DMT)-like permease
VLVGPNFALGGKPLLGDALGALTAVFYAGYFLAIKVTRDAGGSTARLMAWSTTITSIALLPIALLARRRSGRRAPRAGGCWWASRW